MNFERSDPSSMSLTRSFTRSMSTETTVPSSISEASKLIVCVAANRQQTMIPNEHNVRQAESERAILDSRAASYALRSTHESDEKHKIAGEFGHLRVSEATFTTTRTESPTAAATPNNAN